jgi:preprotein translocase subunit YajC
MEERFENFMLEKVKKGACVALQGGILGLIDEPIYPTSGRKTVDRIRR